MIETYSVRGGLVVAAASCAARAGSGHGVGRLFSAERDRCNCQAKSQASQ
jgi:hypothetical protein